jgi:hypothetical protein
LHPHQKHPHLRATILDEFKEMRKSIIVEYW